jgi:hypothetical protein
LAQLVLILIKSFFLDKEIEQMKKKRKNVLVITGIAILGWIGFLYMNAGASHAGYSSPFVPESSVIVVAEYGTDIEQHGQEMEHQEMEYPESNTTGYQPGEENPEPYYEQHGDPESGELADPDQEVPYEEYQEQEVPEEEGVPEGIYELPSEEMPNDEPEIPQG